MIPSPHAKDLEAATEVLAGRELYHVGLVVPDIRAACERHSRLFGTRWAPLRRGHFAVMVDGETREAEIEVSYSVDGSPHVEHIEEISGSVWGVDGLHLNHIGFYADDLRRSMGQLEEAGLPARVHDIGEDGGATMFSYHQDPSGMWVELVHSSFRDRLRAWIGSTTEEQPDLGEASGPSPH